MRHLHILRAARDELALEVIRHQLAEGGEVEVVLTGSATAEDLPAGATAIPMQPLEYDQLVRLIASSDRVVSW